MVLSLKRTEIILVMKSSLYKSGIEQVLGLSDDFAISDYVSINDIKYNSVYSDSIVAIVDVDQPNDNGFITARQLKFRIPNIGIILLASECNDQVMFKALKSQASACLDKDVSAQELIDNIQRVAQGEHPIHDYVIRRPDFADQVFRHFQRLSREHEAKIAIVNLTDRETEILSRVAHGRMNKQIAQELQVSEQTIKNHITAILRKLNVKNRFEAVSVAVKQGFIHTD
jgi:DNA-binding NarL/FixJ family response regulator